MTLGKVKGMAQLPLIDPHFVGSSMAMSRSIGALSMMRGML